nr:RNA-directed DNA polymerase, eukaryota [Tanacetum cinerariifolium]
MDILTALRNIDRIHSMDLNQKAKIKWSIEGDENSKFFHGILNRKHNQTNIRGIMVDGVWNEQPTDVKREFLMHFQDRFAKPTERHASIDMGFPKTILDEQCQDLEREATKEEIKATVWDCGTDKSPGPDGFSFGFYHHFWSIIEHDVYLAVKHFFNHGDIPSGLVNVLGDIVNEVQSAFIAGRQMLDGPFILNEVLQWCSKKKRKSLIFKVNFEKAFDSVRWDFLDDGGAEQNQFDILVELVRLVNLVPMSDRWTWKLESTGDFSVASARRQIDELRLPDIGAETRWVKCVPIKINILAWKIRNYALPTRFNSRGIDIQDMSCPICDNAIESSEHLFFRCSLIRDIGKKIVRWLNMEYEEMNSYDEWKTWIVSRRMGSKLKNMFEGVWYTLWCYVWNHRNKILFDETTPMKSMLLDNVIFNSFHWCKSRSKSSFGWNEWLKNSFLIAL